MKRLTLTFVVIVTFIIILQEFKDHGAGAFMPGKDLLSLHYDFAPDKDDGQSAAADRTILQSMFGKDWIRANVVVVSGAYGKNASRFDPNANAVMDAVWNDCGGWLAGHANRENVVILLTSRWSEVLEAGGDVWVKEGGQSDITADVVRRIRNQFPDIDTTQHIHVVQHSNWNEDHTTEKALVYTKQFTHYIKIRDANEYLSLKGGDEKFVKAAREHQEFGNIWKAAFAYYNPHERIDFSDTGELMHIIGLGEMDLHEFRKRYLSDK